MNPDVKEIDFASGSEVNANGNSVRFIDSRPAKADEYGSSMVGGNQKVWEYRFSIRRSSSSSPLILLVFRGSDSNNIYVDSKGNIIKPNEYRKSIDQAMRSNNGQYSPSQMPRTIPNFLNPRGRNNSPTVESFISQADPKYVKGFRIITQSYKIIKIKDIPLH